MGFRLLQRLAEDVTDLGSVESSPRQDGRNMVMVIGPHKKKAEAKAEERRRKDAEAEAAAAGAPARRLSAGGRAHRGGAVDSTTDETAATAS